MLELTEVRVARVGDVDVAHAIDEGEGFTTVAEWRADHESYWHSEDYRGWLADPTFTITDDTGRCSNASVSWRTSDTEVPEFTSPRPRFAAVEPQRTRRHEVGALSSAVRDVRPGSRPTTERDGSSLVARTISGNSGWLGCSSNTGCLAPSDQLAVAPQSGFFSHSSWREIMVGMLNIRKGYAA